MSKAFFKELVGIWDKESGTPASNPPTETGAEQHAPDISRDDGPHATTTASDPIESTRKEAEPRTQSIFSDKNEESGNHVFHGVHEMEAITSTWSRTALIIGYTSQAVTFLSRLIPVLTEYSESSLSISPRRC